MNKKLTAIIVMGIFLLPSLAIVSTAETNASEPQPQSASILPDFIIHKVEYEYNAIEDNFLVGVIIRNIGYPIVDVLSVRVLVLLDFSWAVMNFSYSDELYEQNSMQYCSVDYEHTIPIHSLIVWVDPEYAGEQQYGENGEILESNEDNNIEWVDPILGTQPNGQPATPKNPNNN